MHIVLTPDDGTLRCTVLRTAQSVFGGEDVEILPAKLVTDVHQQLFGTEVREEAMRLLQDYPDYTTDTVMVVILNGVFEHPIWGWVYQISVFARNMTKLVCCRSRSISIPPEAVAATLKRGQGTTTVGQMMAELYGADPGDPPGYTTGGNITAEMLVEQSLEEALSRLVTL